MVRTKEEPKIDRGITILKKDSVMRLDEMRRIIRRLEANKGLMIIGTILTAAWEFGIDPYQAEKDIRMLEKMGQVSRRVHSITGIEYYSTKAADLDKINVVEKELRTLRDIIRELQVENGVADIQCIRVKASDYGFDPYKVEDEVKFMYLSGTIYEVQKGCYKMTSLQA